MHRFGMHRMAGGVRVEAFSFPSLNSVNRLTKEEIL